MQNGYQHHATNLPGVSLERLIKETNGAGTVAPGSSVSSVLNSTHAEPIHFQVAASVEMNEEVLIDELAVSDLFALSGNATPERRIRRGDIPNESGSQRIRVEKPAKHGTTELTPFGSGESRFES